MAQFLIVALSQAQALEQGHYQERHRLMASLSSLNLFLIDR